MRTKFGFFCLFSFLFLSSSYRCSSPPQTSCFFLPQIKYFNLRKQCTISVEEKLLKVNSFDVNKVFMEKPLNFHISILL